MKNHVRVILSYGVKKVNRNKIIIEIVTNKIIIEIVTYTLYVTRSPVSLRDGAERIAAACSETALTERCPQFI